MRHFAAATKVLHEFGPDTRLMLLQAQRAGFGAPGGQRVAGALSIARGDRGGGDIFALDACLDA
ncbi:hypothetical protein [uncultured Maricaulis sp.]|uniref:hypothetical protein n=1 Tax=uncultured Maricaulis sp. TaxID=174710 RepID=UPI0030D73DEC